jgi:hypothetical protein
MHEAWQGGWAMQVKADAQYKARQKSNARQGRCASQGRADARGKAGQMCGAKQGRCARPFLSDLP